MLILQTSVACRIAAGFLAVVHLGCTTPADSSKPSPRADTPVTFGKVYLTSDALFDDVTDPVISPDGKFLAFRASPIGSELPQLFVAGLAYDASGRPTVRSTPVRITPAGSRNATPAFSPDGRSLVFASTADAETDPLADNARPAFAVRYEQLADLFRADDWQRALAAGDVRAGVDLARHPITDGDGFDGEPAWSPDGKYIAFASDRGTRGGRANVDLYVAEADGTIVARLTTERGADSAPDWSPDGTKIVFESERRRPGSSDIYVVDLVRQEDGGTPIRDGAIRRITAAADARTPVWTPEGEIIYSAVADRGSDGSRELRIVDAEGRNDRSLGLEGEAPFVSSDGRLLVAVTRLGVGRQVFAVPLGGGRVVR